MDERSERDALQDVQDRLKNRFPHLGHEVVEAAVRVAQAQLNGPIRDYVPVLVEHLARDRLSGMSSGQAVPTRPSVEV